MFESCVFCSCASALFFLSQHTDMQKKHHSLLTSVYTFMEPALCSRVCTSQTKMDKVVRDDSLDHLTPLHHRRDWYICFCVISLRPQLQKFFQRKDYEAVTVFFIRAIQRLELSVLVAELHLRLRFCIINVLIACFCSLYVSLCLLPCICPF